MGSTFSHTFLLAETNIFLATKPNKKNLIKKQNNSCPLQQPDKSHLATCYRTSRESITVCGPGPLLHSSKHTDNSKINK